MVYFPDGISNVAESAFDNNLKRRYYFEDKPVWYKWNGRTDKVNIFENQKIDYSYNEAEWNKVYSKGKEEETEVVSV